MISDLTVDKAWTNRRKPYLECGKTHLERGKTYLERGQGYQDFGLIFMFFLLQRILGSPPQKMGNNLIGNKFMHGMMDMFVLISSCADGLTKT